MAVPHEIGHACALGQVGVVEAWLDSDSAHHPNHRGDDAEAIAARNHQITQFVLAEVKAGGGCIKKYLREPIISLNCLRLLCERGRAVAPSGVLATLMGPKLPRELFVHVLSFWRSARALDDRAFDRVRGRYLPTRYDMWYAYEAPDEVIMG
jgi:hypothetical protein